jgi:uncharacterized membrane protein
MIETNQIETVWVEFPSSPLPPEIVRGGVSHIVLEHHWVARTSAGEFGVWQFPKADFCALAIGRQSLLVPITAPVLAVSATGFLLAVGFLLVAGVKLFTRFRRA